MKKQKILFGILAFVLIANFIIPNIVLATDELIDEVETVQEEVVTEEETTESEKDESIVEATEDVEPIIDEVPTEVSDTHYSDGIYYDSEYVTNRDDVIVRMDENQTFYIPAELAEPGTDTRILQSLFLVDEVGNIAATKQVTTLNYGAPYEGATYRLIEDNNNPLFRVTPVNPNGDYSTTPTSYKVEFLNEEPNNNGEFIYDFNSYNEHKGYAQVYNEETGLYDNYSYFNVYTNLKVHFVRYGQKAHIYKYETKEGQMSIYLRFNSDNQCILTHSGSTNDFASALQSYFYMYLPEEGDYTVYATIDEELNTLVEVENEEDAMFKFYIDNALGTTEANYTMTIDWLKNNTNDRTVTLDYIDNLMTYPETVEDDTTITTTIITQRCYNVPIEFYTYKKQYVFDEKHTEKGNKTLYINFDENGKVTLPYDSLDDYYSHSDAEYVLNMLGMYGDHKELSYMDFDGETWSVSYTQTENSYVKVTNIETSQDKTISANTVTLEILKDLPENASYSVKEYYDLVGESTTEDKENVYVTFEYDLYEPITMVLVPYTEEVNYYVENVEIDNENSTAMFEFSVDYDKFLKEGTVYLDGKALSKDQYTSRQGSTIIELAKDILDTLSIGVHTLGIGVSDGYVEAAFQIIEETPVEETNIEEMVEEPVNTADYAPYMISLFVVSLMGIAYAQRKLVVNK